MPQSGTSSSSFSGLMVDPSLWKPGQACPVVACQKLLRKIRDATQFKTHWLEKHEKMVAIYQCSLCSTRLKRKADLYRHLRLKHGCVGDAAFSFVVSCGLCPNQNFVDPAPLTQEIVFNLVTDQVNVCS